MGISRAKGVEGVMGKCLHAGRCYRRVDEAVPPDTESATIPTTTTAFVRDNERDAGARRLVEARWTQEKTFHRHSDHTTRSVRSCHWP